MARPLRLHVPGGFYHVTLRGNHRQPLFDTTDDRSLLDAMVAEGAAQCRARVHAYCWMTNHIHLLMQVSDVPLGNAIRRIASRYARKFQYRLSTTGHLFERRYHAVLIDVDRYLLTVVRYIHLNPVRAGLAASPGEYPWSSHAVYTGIRQSSWVCTSFTLRMFSEDPQRAIRGYREWMEDAAQVGDSETLAHPENPQVLGGDDFLQGLSGNAWQPRSRATLQDVLRDCSRKFGIPAEALRSPSRARNLSAARAWFVHQVVSARISSVSNIGRFLGRSEAAVRKLMLRHAFRDPE